MNCTFGRDLLLDIPFSYAAYLTLVGPASRHHTQLLDRISIRLRAAGFSTRIWPGLASTAGSVEAQD